jgi:hypothetical protein
MGIVARGAFAAGLTVVSGVGGFKAGEAFTPGPEYYQQQRAAAAACIAHYPDTSQPVEQLPPGCTNFAANLPVGNNVFGMPSKAKFQQATETLVQDQEAADKKLKAIWTLGGLVLGFGMAVTALTGERRRTRPRSTTWLARRLNLR